ncbi:FmdB family transcriptional regulator [Brachybacterium vulturis]|uniref:FmdB family transcriptional regulator n=1 Tax=Brachybacterium vulturis TaxID=2017484 RepID=A0A291GQL8_9MICO|nr:FmdB family zinc ribbon protein [Brachybacterium vulturis]ATG52332.1 FmdB family transcriptional regulator [Brachybacterium vulturis]
MPTYVYACKNCGHRFEQYQSFSEDSLRACPECTQDALRKVFDSVGIVFKGPGFYSTDSSTSGSSAAAAGATAAGAGGSTSTGDSASTGAAASTSSGTSATSTPSTQPAPAAS